MLKRMKLFIANIFFMSVLACSVQANEVLEANSSEEPIIFHITDLNKMLFNSVRLKPEALKNGLGRDLKRGKRIGTITPDSVRAKRGRLIVNEQDVFTGHGDLY